MDTVSSFFELTEEEKLYRDTLASKEKYSSTSAQNKEDIQNNPQRMCM